MNLWVFLLSLQPAYELEFVLLGPQILKINKKNSNQNWFFFVSF